MTKPVIRAICRRELQSWFGSPTGYVFIFMFVLLSAIALVVPREFFANNLANLDTLNGLFRVLLLFFVPAVTMGIWANEKSQGTQELLFTLPATDLQILLGKFAAAVGIYTVSLLFTLTLPLALMFLGSPDLGLVVTNYLGYWMLGVLLISVAMVSSQLTDNLTVSFILGALFCGIVVISEDLFGTGWAAYGPSGMFEQIGRGVVPVASIVLFACLTGAFIYLNLALLSRRHWGTKEAHAMHRGLRFGALAVSAIALGIFGLNKLPRLDGTLERLHSLSQDSIEVLDGLDSQRPVYVQAFISDDVPQHMVQTRRTLLDLLRQFDSLGGSALQVRVVATDRATDAADEAERNFGIGYREERDETGPHYTYLGLAFQCGTEEVVIQYMDRKAPVEYEITRSIRTVGSASRRKVGVLRTDVDIFGGFDFQSMRQIPKWEIVSELELQYDVESVPPDVDYPEDLDVLMVPMASSLTQPQMDRLAAHVRAGGPTLIFDDPFPASAPGVGPMDPKGGPQNPMMMGAQPPPEQKGDIAGLLLEFDINWPLTSIVWQNFNPHPLLDGIQPELLFITPGSGSSAPFNPSEAVTSGLQELIIVFGGHVQEAGEAELSFIPLLRTGDNSGILEVFEVFRTDPFFGQQMLNPGRVFRPDRREKTLAARVSGTPAGSENSINLIFVADLDMIGSEFFYMRRRGFGDTNIQFDNVTFALNCIDELAGDLSFIDLRKRRPQHRTLERLEGSQARFTEGWINARNRAETEAASLLTAAQRRFDDKVAAVEAMGLDAQSQAIRIGEIREVENRRLDFARAQIERDKQNAIGRAEAEMNQQRSALQDRTKALTLAFTPLPAILVGLLVFSRKKKRGSPGGAQ